MTHRDARMTRRTALKAASAVGLAGLGPSTAAAQNSPAISSDTKLTVTGYFRSLAFLVAGHKGFFARERLDVEFHVVRLAPEHNKGMAEGRWPITLSSAGANLPRLNAKAASRDTDAAATVGESNATDDEPAGQGAEFQTGRGGTAARRPGWPRPMVASKDTAARTRARRPGAEGSGPPPRGRGAMQRRTPRQRRREAGAIAQVR